MAWPRLNLGVGLTTMNDIPDGFEIIFITEGDDASPAAEIQFRGQRLCVLRECGASTEIEFVEDKYLGKSVSMQFPLANFSRVTDLARRELTQWRANIAAKVARQNS